MATLFQETRIGKMALRNRIVRSATWEGMCGEDGAPTGKLAGLYRHLAAGGVGLLVTGNAAVLPGGRQLPGTMIVSGVASGEAMQEIARVVHDEGGAVCVQLVHAGGQAPAAAGPSLAPSAVESAQYPQVPVAMTAGDIETIETAFADGAARVREWGFDAVQFHAAHGYLISEFLSPHTNRREDGYGGGVRERSRFLLEILSKVRAAVGGDFPVLVKMNGSDFLEGGLDKEDALQVARLLDEAGIDAVEVSGGTPASGKQAPVRTKIDSVEREAYHLPLAARIREAVSCPVMAVGGFRSYEVAAGAVERGAVDFVSLSRPLIREPGLPRRWREGDRRRAACISCNGCFRAGLKGGIYCVKEREGEKRRKG